MTVGMPVLAVRAAVTVTVRASARHPASAQTRQRVRDGFGGIWILGAHTSNFTCDLTCI